MWGIQPHILYPQLSQHQPNTVATTKPRSRLHICSTFKKKKKNEKLAGLLHQEAKSFPFSGCPQDGDTGMRAAQMLELSDLISFLPRLTEIFPRLLTRCAPWESQMCLHEYRQQAFASEPSLVSGDLGLNCQMMRGSLPSSG